MTRWHLVTVVSPRGSGLTSLLMNWTGGSGEAAAARELGRSVDQQEGRDRDWDRLD